MTVFFTSDLHFGHTNIINFCRRPFHSVDNMNKLLVQNWNEVVTDNDTVFVLGDLAMGQFADTIQLCAQLNGTKFLVPGNHDRCHPMHGAAKVLRFRPMYEAAGFVVLPPLMMLPVNELGTVTLCHFPTTGDSHDQDRFDEYRPVTDDILLHGHTHSKVATADGRQFNVGVDAHDYRPVTINEIVGN